MNEMITGEKSELLSLLHGGGLTLPQPFVRDIFLFDSFVAGTSHIEGIDELEPHIQTDDRLTFLREPENLHDKMAIAVLNGDGIKIGYVPRKDNPVFARLMDAGKLLFGKVSAKEKKEGWLRIDMRIFLHE